MNDRSSQSPVLLGISAVERDTGLSKDTLRVWERRYGFPCPARDQFGERAYPIDQVDKLRIMRRLMDAGHRPGKIIALSVDSLQRLAAETLPAPRAGSEFPVHEELQLYLDLCKAHDVDALRRALSQATLRLGLERFVTEVVAPLNRLVGEAWARGWFEIFEEHLYTESMQVILRNAISTIPRPRQRPRVLLTTFPNEQHGLGLLMAEAVLSLEGCECLSLGVQTPIYDIVRAAQSQQADIVALSFSGCLSAGTILDGLVELSEKLPGGVQIWAGGHCPVLQRKPPRDVLVLPALQDIHAALEGWHASHPGMAH